ncbi:major facilitator transporter [Bifidobacterium pseudolongum subsp. globosum]|uniref:Major facilitator transporter n=1 Tax=Bifidobacterium pseudolongum subsp. globosum TaxID=1690 RepID=A0A2N3QGC8_9BIFI|nr:hypothetical protein [Bifidobacterium pseudolongum]PKU90171.1 major facilitator transporter [Bifidobacterium pseudolongum subsp. globosum]
MGAVTGAAATRRSFWRAPNYAAWFTADTASAAGGSLRALAVSLAGYAVSGAAARRIHTPRMARAATVDDARPSFFGDFVGGWSWTLHRPMLVTVMVAAAMLNFGAFAAARMSDRVPVGGCICVSFVFLCACVAPMLVAYGPGVSDGAAYALVFVANAVMGLPFPIIDALLLGFVYAKAPTSMQGRIAVSLTVPAQALSAFSSASAGTLLPTLGFRGTVVVFLAALMCSAAIVLCSARIRRIPRADGWDAAEL